MLAVAIRCLPFFEAWPSKFAVPSIHNHSSKAQEVRRLDHNTVQHPQNHLQYKVLIPEQLKPSSLNVGSAYRQRHVRLRLHTHKLNGNTGLEWKLLFPLLLSVLHTLRIRPPIAKFGLLL